MLSRHLKVTRYAGIFLFAAVFCGLLAFPYLKGKTASPDLLTLQKQMEAVKSQIAENGMTPALKRQLANLTSQCGVLNQSTKPTINAPFAPLASLCVNGSLALTDPQFNRPASQTTGSGVQSPCIGSGNASFDVYSFNLSSCAVFPTEVTITTCGPAGCSPIAVTDTAVHLYRNVAAGDPLTANGGLPGVFNAASACTNIRAANANLNGGASSTPGTGNTCNQTNTANCLGACAANNSTSGFRRQLGNGRFTVVVSATNTTDTGGYNLYIDAPAAGCNVALAPTAANANIGGRVLNAGGFGIGKATITITGDGIQTMQARTNAFGYYNFDEIPTGGTYVLTISGTKTYTFSKPTRVVSLNDSIADADFVSEQ